MKEYGSRYAGDDSIILNNESPSREEFLFYTDQHQDSELWFLRGAKIEYQRSVWPRRCCISKQMLWGKTAVRARRPTRGLSGAVEVIEDRWYACNEFLMLKLKG
jgi:hypothetical protein